VAHMDEGTIPHPCYALLCLLLGPALLGVLPARRWETLKPVMRHHAHDGPSSVPSSDTRTTVAVGLG